MQAKKKILLINSPSLVSLPTRCLLGLGYISSFLKQKGFDVCILNLNIWKHHLKEFLTPSGFYFQDWTEYQNASKESATKARLKRLLLKIDPDIFLYTEFINNYRYPSKLWEKTKSFIQMQISSMKLY